MVAPGYYSEEFRGDNGSLACLQKGHKKMFAFIFAQDGIQVYPRQQDKDIYYFLSLQTLTHVFFQRSGGESLLQTDVPLSVKL